MATFSKRGRRVTSVRGFVDATFKQPGKTKHFFAYRGHKSESYKLRPSIFRKVAHRKNERRLLQELMTSSADDFIHDKSTFDYLVRAQHFGLPTRLMDVTLNPLVALYFASEELSSEEVDRGLSETGEVIILEIADESVKYFNSDAVSCLANMAYLTDHEKKSLPKPPIDLDAFNNDPIVDRLHQFIKAEKPGFRPIMKPEEPDNIYFVIPKDSNKRIIAQSSRFLIFGRGRFLKDGRADITISTIKIDGSSKGQIREQLDRLAINGRTLFPEIESSARYIKSKF